LKHYKKINKMKEHELINALRASYDLNNYLANMLNDLDMIDEADIQFVNHNIQVAKNALGIGNNVKLTGQGLVDWEEFDIKNLSYKLAARHPVSINDFMMGVESFTKVSTDYGLSYEDLGCLITAINKRSGRGETIIVNTLKSIFSKLQSPDFVDLLKSFEINLATKEILSILDIITTEIKTPEFKEIVINFAGGLYNTNMFKDLLAVVEKRNGESIFSITRESLQNA